MYTVKDIEAVMESWAPSRTAVSGDNVGLLCGRRNAAITRAVAALDVTGSVIARAAELGAGIIVAHHPLFRGAVSRVTDETVTGRLLLSLAENRIAALCMHTNLDAADGGVNDCLAAALGFELAHVLDPDKRIGRWGDLPQAMTAGELAGHAKKRLGAGVRLSDAGRPVSRLAVCGGSGNDLFEFLAAAGCDTLLVGELKHSSFLEAAELGINIVECGHFATENVVVAPVAARLRAALTGLEVTVSEVSGVPYTCL